MAGSSKEHRILVIDDNEDIADLVSLFLAKAGFKALSATTGPDGIAMAALGRPSVILCDLGLPGCSGAEVLAAVRRDPGTRDIPFILMTGRVDDGFSGEFIPDARVLKPFEMQEVVRTVHEQIKNACQRKAA